MKEDEGIAVQRLDHWRSLTFKAVDIMFAVHLWEARLVAVLVYCSDPRFTASTAFPWGDDGIAHTSVCQPPWTAVVQPIVPGNIQLSSGRQFSTMTQTVGLGLPEGEMLRGRPMEYLTFTEKGSR